MIRNILITIIGVFLLYSLSKTLLDYHKKISFYNEYNHEYEAEKDINKKLRSTSIKSQDYYSVERNIREQLNLTKPGEVVVIIPKITIVPTQTPKPIRPIYQQWGAVFF